MNRSGHSFAICSWLLALSGCAPGTPATDLMSAAGASQGSGDGDAGRPNPGSGGSSADDPPIAAGAAAGGDSTSGGTLGGGAGNPEAAGGRAMGGSAAGSMPGGGTSGNAESTAAGVGGTAGANAGYNPCPTNGNDCTLMPLGDSITDGYTVRGGYRIPFFQRGRREGKRFTFVGSQVNGPTTVDMLPFPQHHEGHSAHTMYDAPNAPIPRKGIANYVPDVIPRFHPDIVLLMIGTNDVDGKVDLPNAPKRLGALIDSISVLDAHSLIVVAQITPTMQDPLNQAIATYNAGIPAIVKSRADAGKHVVLVDMYGAFVKDADFKSKYLSDRLHPNAAGYQVMSDVWNSAIQNLLQ